MTLYSNNLQALETANSSAFAVSTNVRTSGRVRSVCSARLGGGARSLAAERRGRSSGAPAGSRVHNRELAAASAATNPEQAIVRRYIITATPDNHHRIIGADRAVASMQTGSALPSAA